MTSQQPDMPSAAIIAHRDADTRARVREAIAARCRIHGECDTRRDLERLYACLDEGVVVSGTEFHDGDALESLIRLGNEAPLPVIIITDKRSLDLVQKAARDHVMAYLLEPLDTGELVAAMVLAQQRFSQLQELRSEVETLQQALAERKVIEQAKGVIMAREGMNEAEAYRALRSRAQDGRVRIAVLAQQIVGEQGNG